MIGVSFNKFGYVENGEIDLNKLTILTGENNTGKTYVSYAVYGLIGSMKDVVIDNIVDGFENITGSGVIVVNLREVLNKSFRKLLNKISSSYSENLHDIFSVSRETFKDSLIKLKIDNELFFKKLYEKYIESIYIFPSIKGKDVKFEFSKEMNSFDLKVSYFNINNSDVQERIFHMFCCKEISEQVFDVIQNNVFLLPAERAGLNLFYKELNVNRNRIVHEMGKLKTNKIDDRQYRQLSFFDLISERVSLYPKPISDYIEFLNKLDFYSKRETTEFQGIAYEIQSDILKGKYEIDEKNIYFIPDLAEGNMDKRKINLHVSSSTVKTFFGLVFYLKYMAEKGDCLIIDEPELNLHPDNQRKIARILVKIANKGINIIISTHSDYIIRELNNLIMLNNDFKDRDKLMQKYNYSEDELLSIEDISAYLFTDNTIRAIEVNRYEGIIAETFDKVINSFNESSDEIFYTLQEEMDCECWCFYNI